MNTTEHVTNKGQKTTRIPNKLIDEKSPYLLQHAYNPVNWHPWSEEAFEKATKENKPIFLSIGYSTCHWCHVMSEESFEDEGVAALLNEFFVCIKVDREERPDIDTVYMNICQATTGQGGWPLTILMTPYQKPFYAATYLPKHTRYGIPGLMELLDQVAVTWGRNPTPILRTGDQIAEIMKREFEVSSDSAMVTRELAALAVTQFNQNFDHDYGGFGNEPKFPVPHNLMFLLRYARLEKDETALFMVENTLMNMYRGGIYDHVGYGFSRYSTDARWLVPHFEKMLYDNALLAMTYTEAYQYTGNPIYRTVAQQILEYVRREMTSPEGGFYCAQDADSEGGEGTYYVFTPDEATAVLGTEDGSFFCEYFNITKEGNFEGASIPNLIKSRDLKPENERVQRVCDRMYSYRRDRRQLHKDDKLLTSWNALMITAYATASKVFQREDYAEAAQQAAEFIRTRLTDESGRLYVRFREDNAAYYGFLDDYAYYCMALCSLYDATFEIKYIQEALRLAGDMLEYFWDDKYGGFFLNATDSEQLIYRPKELYDGALPSGNSVAACALLRLARLTADSKMIEYADKQLRFLAGQVKDSPSNHSFALMAFLGVLHPSREIVCVTEHREKHPSEKHSPEKHSSEKQVSEKYLLKKYVTENTSPTNIPQEDLFQLKSYLSEHYEPNTVALVKTPENEKDLLSIAGYTRDYRTINGQTTYYICENYRCLPPTNQLLSPECSL
ncbi:hypothetical protein HNQ56_000708 [Anaerotaenia torta]|uniref:thioredoxin domain-containing protein n=1 Tax=Anaerotaenia torta TaxID=433293 RepID=UPI003D1BB432